MIRSISWSLRRSGGKPFIFIPGQMRTDFGSRIRACSPNAGHVFGRIHRQVEIGAKVGSARPVQSCDKAGIGQCRASGRRGRDRPQAGSDRRRAPGQRATGESWLSNFANWYAQYSLLMLATSGPVHTT